MFGLAVLLLLSACAASRGTGAGSRTEGPEQGVVDRSAAAVARMRVEGGELFGSLLAEARGVLIVPNLVRLGYLASVSGGDAVLLVRNATDRWSLPAFYRLARGGFGMQLGVERSVVVLLLMDEGVVAGTLRSGLEFGAGADLTVFGGVGRSDVSTLYSDQPVHVFVLSDGAWAGVALEGGVFQYLTSANEAYYGPGATAEAILEERRFSAPGVEKLLLALQRAEMPEPVAPVLNGGRHEAVRMDPGWPCWAMNESGDSAGTESPWISLGWVKGLEPATPWATTRCSAN